MHRFISLVFTFLPLCSVANCREATGSLMNSFKETRESWDRKIHGVDIRHRWSEDGTSLYASLWDSGKKAQQWFSYDTETGERQLLAEEPKKAKSAGKIKPSSAPEPRKSSPSSPDGKRKAGLSEDVIRLTPDNGKPIALKFHLPEGSKWQERFDWAPDSAAFVAWHVTSHPVRQVQYVRSRPEDELQPQHFTRDYIKPGDLLNIPRPVVFFTDGSEPLPLDPELSAHPFEIRNLLWHPDSETLTVEFIERGFGEFKLIEINTKTREQRVLLTEKSDKFVYVYGNSYCRQLANGKEILWLSQRTGFNHLYLIDRSTGDPIRPLTSGEWTVREIFSVDEKARTVLASVSGIDPTQDPYHIHYIRIDLDTGEITRLTRSDGTHEIFPQPDGETYLAQWSRVDQPPAHELRRWKDGKLIATLPAPDTTELQETGWQAPERFVAKDRNGKFDIHGVILRPSNFNPAEKYPVVENIYAGPHGSFVPKSWRTWFGDKSEMAESGFIVVQIDGLGTNYRGKEFHEHAYKNLMDSGLPDRIKWMKAAAEKYPQLDLDRVGIYGGSAGGQSALAALLNHPDFYKAAAADCGCHDNRMDKIWWNEQWMDWPVDESYEQNANVTHIENLEGALLLTVGELDTNVDPASTYQVVDALIKADKDFEYFMAPGGGHGIGESPYLRRKRIEFFQKNLLAREPAD